MHTDARSLDNDSLIQGDLCIVGAGAAGITIAREWIDSRLNVVLLEGGGFELEPEMQDLYRGDIVGQPYYPLQSARLHYFGGTTGHWAGFCATYDPIDFEKRDWIAHSGWPITRADLDPFYPRAAKLLDLGPYEYFDVDNWVKGKKDLQPLPFDPNAVWSKMWQFSPPTRFGTKYRDEILNARNIHLYTHANVCEIEATDGLSAVDSLHIRMRDGKQHRVKARCYVLACSTIQNTRLLLASNRQARTGLGNANDLVGRYFMEHLEMPSGELVLAKPESTNTKLYALDFGVTKARAELSLSAEMQKKYQILNGTTSLEPGTLGEDVKSTFQFLPPQTLSAQMEWEKGGKVGPPPETSALPPATLESLQRAATLPRVFHLITRQEQAPNPNSRVTLSTDKDALGMPRARLDWQLTELDKRSIRTFYKVLGQEIGRIGIGRVQIRDWLFGDDRAWPTFLSGGWHHMGTTRMHNDPKQGVVDATCKVHGIGNLYVAGAAVYPTAGPSNPTLTLVALSLRLSDYLRRTIT